MTARLGALAEALRQGMTTSRELVEGALSRIRETDGVLNAFITVDERGALAAADGSDRRRAAGCPLSPYDGIPFAAKDNLQTAGLCTTCASEALSDALSETDAETVARLRAAGFVLIGKTNMDEFAMGSVTAASAFGASHNPHDPRRTCGGSSGGSAAAVAAGVVPFALGSDTGGSVRQPAAFCGTVGVKPTYDLLPRGGMVDFAPSLDTVGLLTTCVSDAAALLGLLTEQGETAFTSDGTSGVHGLRVGLICDLGNTAPVAAMLDRVSAVLSAGGAKVERLQLPFRESAPTTYRLLAYTEGALSLSRPELRQNGVLHVGHEVKRRVLFGALMASEGQHCLDAAEATRRAIRAEFDRLFGAYDVLIRATAPFGAFPLDRELTVTEGCDMDYATVCESLAGIPAVSIPFGRDGEGMPLGVQIAAPQWEDRRMLSVGAYLEEHGL